MDDDQKKYSDKKDGENDLELIVDATPAVDDGPPIPPGHQRFFCEKCRAVRMGLVVVTVVANVVANVVIVIVVFIVVVTVVVTVVDAIFVMFVFIFVFIRSFPFS